MAGKGHRGPDPMTADDLLVRVAGFDPTGAGFCLYGCSQHPEVRHRHGQALIHFFTEHGMSPTTFFGRAQLARELGSRR